MTSTMIVRQLCRLLILSSISLNGNGDSGTSGHDFVFSIPISSLRNAGTPRIYISTSSTQPCPTSVTIPSLDFERTATTSRSMQANVQLPSFVFPSRGLSYAPSVIVQSSCMVSVYVLVRYSSWGGGSFTVFPSTNHGREYIVLMHGVVGEDGPSYFSISAFKTKTFIHIETTTEKVIDLVLDPYQTYLYEYSGDLTGTFIRANESVSVISGTVCGRTSPGRACAILLEQVPPVFASATVKQEFRFILGPFLGQALPGYVYRIVGASDNNATILVDNQLFKISKSQWVDRTVSSDKIVSIISDEPVYVVQYMKGSLYHGGGSMVVIPPIVSYVSSISFSAFSGGENNINCYINTIIKCEDVQGLTLDDSVRMAQWSTLASQDRDMCVVRGKVQAGVHSVSHTNEAAKFLVIFYGVPLTDAFAFSNVAGLNLASGYTTIPTTITTKATSQMTSMLSTTDQPKSVLKTTSILAVIAVLIVLFLIIVLLVICRRKKKKRRTLRADIPIQDTQIECFLDVMDCNFPRHRLRIIRELGSGNFGRVLLAETCDITKSGVRTLVAVKMLREGAPAQDKESFLRELNIHMKLKPHPFVLSILGCCTDSDPYYLIVEYMARGNLKEVLMKSRLHPNVHGPDSESSLTQLQLLSFAKQVAEGMAFVASNKFIHRDLAARNILVSEDLVCKVSDFGLARDIMNDRVYERKSDTKLPIRWMAIESLLDDVFTTECDVWSFGILLWEIVTLGARPYPGMGTVAVRRKLQEGYRMPQPKHCQREVYDIMLACWSADPSRRPSFTLLVKQIDRILDIEADYLLLEEIEECLYDDTILPDEEEKV